MRVRTLLVFAAAMIVLCAPMTFAQLTNGGFETGDYTGWTTGGNFEFTQVVSGPFYVYNGAQEGSFYSTQGPVSSDGTLSQSFNDTAGQQYVLSFWLAAVGDDPSDFSAQVNGVNVFSQNDPNNGGVWTDYTFQFTGTGHDTISFAFRDDPAYTALDNVSVSPVANTVPEPSSFLLMGSGVLGLAGVIRRKLRG